MSKSPVCLEVELTASDVMSKDPLTVPVSLSLHQLARVLFENRIKGAPVTNAAGELVGVVSQGDIIGLGARESDAMDEGPSYFHTIESEDMDWYSEDMQFNHPAESCVADVCSTIVFTAHPDTPLLEVAATMVGHGVHRIIVVQDEIPVGIISILDVLAGLVRCRVESMQARV